MNEIRTDLLTTEHGRALFNFTMGESIGAGNDAKVIQMVVSAFSIYSPLCRVVDHPCAFAMTRAVNFLMEKGWSIGTGPDGDNGTQLFIAKPDGTDAYPMYVSKYVHTSVPEKVAYLN